jgi:hypothetical protein
MHWVDYIAYFFGGAFLVNAIPHFVSGVTGHPFQTPFAKPPGKGLSPSWVNVLWSAFNVAVGYLLIIRVGTFDMRDTADVIAAGVGGLVMALVCAKSFGRFHGGD